MLDERSPLPGGNDPPRPFTPPSWRDRLDLLVDTPAWSPTSIGLGVAGMVAVVVVGIVLLRPATTPAPEVELPRAGGPADPATTTTTAAPEAVAHAAGAVQVPGVYRVPPGGRVGDLLALAGGAAPDADLNRLNLAAPVTDGSQVYVPRVGEVPPTPVAPPGGEAGASGQAAGPLDINTATQAELEELPGVGPATAEAILAERDRRGRFETVDDLLDVRGIGEAKLAQVRDLVRV